LGHLRPEKDPLTLFAAVRLLPPGLPIRIRHVGMALDAGLGAEARALQAMDSRYRHVGPLPHGLARVALQRAHLLVHPSRMEGGANAIVESITAGTPVIASRVSGNVGMLGASYEGYFEPGDCVALANRLVQAFEAPSYLRALAAQCRARIALFSPAAESRSVGRLVAELVSASPALKCP
jgi:glycosyltransferase involved in cell wall biosynthesis